MDSICSSVYSRDGLDPTFGAISYPTPPRTGGRSCRSWQVIFLLRHSRGVVMTVVVMADVHERAPPASSLALWLRAHVDANVVFLQPRDFGPCSFAPSVCPPGILHPE